MWVIVFNNFCKITLSFFFLFLRFGSFIASIGRVRTFVSRSSMCCAPMLADITPHPYSSVANHGLTLAVLGAVLCHSGFCSWVVVLFLRSLPFFFESSGELWPSFSHVQQVPSRFVISAESLLILVESSSRRKAVGAASTSSLGLIATQRPDSNRDWYSSTALSQMFSTVVASGRLDRAEGVFWHCPSGSKTQQFAWWLPRERR